MDETFLELLADELGRPWVIASLVLVLGLAAFLGWRFFRLRMGTLRPAGLAFYAAVLLVGGFFAAGGPWRWADERDRRRFQESYHLRLESEEAARKKTLADRVHAIRVRSRSPARPRVLRLTAAGDIDPSFSASGFNGSILSLLAQPDGRVLVTGQFEYLIDGPDPKLARAVVRLLPDGRPDELFTLRASRPSGAASWVALGAEGGILLGLTGSSAPVVRLLPTGAPDESFGPPSLSSWPALHGSGEALELLYTKEFLARFDQAPLRAALQPDGKLLVVGRFRSVGPNAAPSGAARFEGGRFDHSFVPEGSLQVDFVPVPLVDGTVIALFYGRRGTVVLGPDGRIDEERTWTLARSLQECVGTLEHAKADDRGGFFGAGKDPSGGNGTLARFTPDLACDPSFAPGLRGTAVTALAPLPRGGVLVATFP